MEISRLNTNPSFWGKVKKFSQPTSNTGVELHQEFKWRFLNNGTPKSSILIGFSIINHPFWAVFHYFWKHPSGNYGILAPKRLFQHRSQGGFGELQCKLIAKRTGAEI